MHPENDRLFQQPRVNVEGSDNVWYTKTDRREGYRKVYEGHFNRSKFKQDIHQSLRSCDHNNKISTCWCGKAEIMKLTGHRNIKSLDSYNADSSEVQKRHYSSILQSRPVQPNAQNQPNIEMTDQEKDFSLMALPQNITPPTQNIQNNLMINSHAEMQRQRPAPAYYFSHSTVHIHNYT